jgi:hypothetical protein
MSGGRRIIFYTIIAIFSIVIALSIVEVILRTASFSSGTGSGEASKRWFEQYWKPVNKLGYRDYEIDFNAPNPTVVFLGDSFTAGHGVKFEETYYFKFKKSENGFNSINLGKNGASTLDEVKTYKEYLSNAKGTQKYLVHQYFGNDIADYISPVNFEQNKILVMLGEYSELANLVQNLLFVKKFSDKYVAALQEAYQDKERMGKHLKDVGALHKIAKEVKAGVIIVAFPFLNDFSSIDLSSVYVVPLKSFFLENCKEKDFFVDVSPLARSLSNRERVVNSMDAHPSAKLHEEVGSLIQQIVDGQIDKLPKYVYLCPR